MLARVAWLAVLPALACQRTPAESPAPPAPQGVARSDGGRAIDRDIAMVEEMTGARLSLRADRTEHSTIYPAWLPDNRLVVPSAYGASIVEPRSGKAIPVEAYGHRAVVSPDGKVMAIASSPEIQLVEVATGQVIVVFGGVFDDLDDQALQFSADGRLFAFPLRQRSPESTVAVAGEGAGGDEDWTGIGLYDVAARAMRGHLTLRGPVKPAEGLTAKYAALPNPNDEITTFELRNERIVASLASGASALWDTKSLELLLVIGGGPVSEGRRERPVLSEDGAFAAVWTAASLTPPAKGNTPAVVAKKEATVRIERQWTPLLVDARAGEVVMRLEDRQCAPFALAMHPREPLLAVGSRFPTYCVWDLAGRKITQRARIPAASPRTAPGAGLVLRLAAKMAPKMDLPIENMSFDATGERLTLGIAHLGSVVVKRDGGAVVEGALSKDAAPADPSSEVALSPDRSMVAGSGREARVWDVPSGQVLRRMTRHERHALLSWTEDAVTIVGTDGTLLRFHSATGELADRRPRPGGLEDAKVIASGGNVFMIGTGRPSGLRAVRLDPPAPAVSLAWPGAMDGVVAAAASARGHRIAVSASEQLVVFDAATGTALSAFAPHGTNPLDSNSPSALALDDEGQLVAAIVHDAPRVWDIASRREIRLSPGDCSDVKFQPKSSVVIAACHEQVRLWDARTGAALAAVDSADVPEGFFFDATGTRVAQLGATHLTWLDGRTLATLGKTEPLPPSTTAAFSPNGRIVAVGRQNGDGVEFYRAADGKRLAHLQLWPNDEAWTVRTHDGKVEVFGDVEKVRKHFACRVDTHDFPLPACEERLLVKGLFRDILTERIAGAP